MKPQNAPDAASGPGMATTESSTPYNADYDRLPADFKALIDVRFAQAAAAAAAKAGRSIAATKSNGKRGQNVHKAINEILDVVSLYDQPELDLAIEVRAQLAKRLDELGLTRLPCTKTIIKAIRLRKASSGVLP